MTTVRGRCGSESRRIGKTAAEHKMGDFIFVKKILSHRVTMSVMPSVPGFRLKIFPTY